MSIKAKRQERSPAEGMTDSLRQEKARRGAEQLQGFPRRDFLKASGFLVAGAAVGCSRGPAPEAIPLLEGSPEMVPGQSNWYASTCGACSAACGAVVRSRDGRPLKLEGNSLHALSRGGLCAVGQASLLELYDSQRLPQPLWKGEATALRDIDPRIEGALNSGAGRAIRLLTETIHSPSELAAITRFGERFEDFRHVVYDPLSCSAILDAHAETHGSRVLPHYRFEAAEVVVSFDADFLATWISPVEFTAGYSAARDLSGDPPRMSYHLQFESRVSLTGSNADQRVTVHPAEQTAWMSHLAAELAHRSSEAIEPPFAVAGPVPPPVAAAAERLWQARGHALVVCGSQDLEAQILCNLLNHLLDGYGRCLDLEHPSQQKQGSDKALAELRQELAEGQVEALLIRGVNPVYDLPGGEEWAELIARVPLSVSFSQSLDETASVAGAVCPEPHFLADWRDAEPVLGMFSLTQPLVRHLGQARGFASSLLAWSGDPHSELEWLQETWKRQVWGSEGSGEEAEAEVPGSPDSDSSDSGFRAFWDRALHDGFTRVERAALTPGSFDPAVLTALNEDGAGHSSGDSSGDSLSLLLYPKAGMLDGRHAHNGWLQELPDPVSKVSWDNYACLSPAAASRLGIEEGDLVRISGSDGDQDLVLPTFLQPGQHDAVVAVAVGYGRAGTDRFADVGPVWVEGQPTVEEGGTVGVRAAGWLNRRGGELETVVHGVKVELAGGHQQLAKSQVYNDLEVPEKLRAADGHPRPIVQQASLAAYRADRTAGTPHGHFPEANLWPDFAAGKHHWGMAIDLTACTGCSACVIACQVENNIPVVGRDEVRRRRDLYWMRIDRYYSQDGDDLQVSHQPMLCHHCDNAPCESVCPVLATVHSEEGLNQQVYNRCVGTRYCANNCPLKVRRFNWFEYSREDATANLVLNPDVTVRSRGVMEKCSFCVQRIQEAKISAGSRGEELAAGAVETACQQSCPAGAIVFGDLANPDSEIVKSVADPRHYRLFEELNIQPSVGYQRLIRNQPSHDQPSHDQPSHDRQEEEEGHVDSHA